VGDAAVVFDPLQIESIASAMRQLTQDADLRSTLEERGSRRLKDFSWEQTARAYIALYRQVARAEAPEAYANLLKSDWMQQPKGQAP
jgi:glycosyltransferase involved in cell wall biosynthesis